MIPVDGDIDEIAACFRQHNRACAIRWDYAAAIACYEKAPEAAIGVVDGEDQTVFAHRAFNRADGFAFLRPRHGAGDFFCAVD